MTFPMPEPGHNLLVEPLIRVEVAKREVAHCTLPGVLECLAQDRVAAFKGLQAHQRHAWYAFLVQLVAIALHRTREQLTDQGEERWRELLRGLTDGRDEPWCLIVPNLAQPAFFQPPVPEGTLDGFKPPVAEPDELDILVTSRNHDVKTARMRAATADQWVYSLVCLQTTQGFSGRDNYGIARMNSGFGNRPGVGLAPSLRWGARFRRDVELLLASRGVLLAAGHGWAGTGGKALLWLDSWDGTTSVGLPECDPFLIEICRRVRLTVHGHLLLARMASTKVRRVNAEHMKGDTGDPWTPVDRNKHSALTVGSAGFGYDLTQQLLLGNTFKAGIAGEKNAGEAGSFVLLASALARGQGGTEGLHERVLPVPPPISVRLGRPEERARLGLTAQRRVDSASTMRRKVLHPALCALLQSDAQRLDLRDSRTESWLRGFDSEVDTQFFDRLWQDSDVDDAEGDRRWCVVLRNIGRAQLESAISSVPVPSARRYRAIAGAERRFGAAAAKHLPQDVHASEEACDGNS